MRTDDMDKRFHPTQRALASGDVEQMRALLKADPELARARSQCSHPTILQCLVLNMPPADTLEELIDLLASHGAELTDPLIAACGMDNVRAVTKLLDLGARIEGNGQWSPLEEATYFGNEAAVSLLLARGAPITKLRTAAALGRTDLIAAYFDKTGALPPEAGEIAWPFGKMRNEESLRNDRQQILANALVYAAQWGRLDAALLLIARGAPVNLIPAGFDYAGTPLHYAAFRGHRQMVDMLLGHGADPAIPDTKISKLAEDWAAHNGHNDLAAYLRNVREHSH